jgi:hypothetical protein
VQNSEVGATPVLFTTGSSNLEQEKMFRKHATSVDYDIEGSAISVFSFPFHGDNLITNQPMELSESVHDDISYTPANCA